MALKKRNYYEFLGVSRDASENEIREAYEMSRLTFSADSLATYSLINGEENHRMLEQTEEAFHTLSHHKRRSVYDGWLTKVESGADSEESYPATSAADSQQIPIAAAISPKSPSPWLPDTMDTSLDSEPKLDSLWNPAEQRTSPSQQEQIATYVAGVSVFSGKELRKLRKLRGYTVDQLAQITRIRRSYLEYIEEERFDALPSAIYVRGFLRIVGDLLQLPTQRVVRDYMDLYHAARGAR